MVEPVLPEDPRGERERVVRDTVFGFRVIRFPTSIGGPSVFMPIGPKRSGKGDPDPM